MIIFAAGLECSNVIKKCFHSWLPVRFITLLITSALLAFVTFDELGQPNAANILTVHYIICIISIFANCWHGSHAIQNLLLLAITSHQAHCNEKGCGKVHQYLDESHAVFDDTMEG